MSMRVNYLGNRDGTVWSYYTELPGISSKLLAYGGELKLYTMINKRIAYCSVHVLVWNSYKLFSSE